LTLPDRSTEVLPIAPNSPEDGLTASADLQPGAYSLRWQVLAVDGHITRGDVPFTVGPANAGASTASSN
jgi:copper resistance protein C